MSYHPGRRRCRLGHSESGRHNVSIQIDNSHLREDTELLVLLLYPAATYDYKDLYYQSEKGKQNVYSISVLNCLLGDDVCSDLCSSVHSQDAIRSQS